MRAMPDLLVVERKEKCSFSKWTDEMIERPETEYSEQPETDRFQVRSATRMLDENRRHPCETQPIGENQSDVSRHEITVQFPHGEEYMQRRNAAKHMEEPRGYLL